MIRLLGAITGSALALATLLVVIGIPQFKTEPAASETAIVTLPRPTSPVDTGDDVSDMTDVDVAVEPPEASAANTNVIAGGAAIETAVTAVDVAAIENETRPVSPPVAESRDEVLLPAVESRPALDTPQSWYAFWSPFRSELAANGFVAQLQSVTGLDYRVVRVKPGVYEVAFAYEDDADITTNLTQITAATGLELPQ